MNTPGAQVIHLDDEHHALALLGAARASKKQGRQVSVREFVSQLILESEAAKHRVPGVTKS
jgi:hypothetical protein